MKRKKKRSQAAALCIMLLLAAAVLYGKNTWGEGRQETKKEKETEPEAILYKNAWIVSGKEQSLILFIDGKLCEYQAEGAETLRDVLADVEITGERVTRVRLKEDTIRGKILAVGKNFIEVEGYGRLALDEDFAVYKNFGELEQLDYSSILVGYDAQELIVGAGKVCGAVIEEEVRAVSIRVLIMSGNYEGNYHEQICLSSDQGMLISNDQESISVKEKEEVIIDRESNLLKNGRIVVSSAAEDGKIKVSSLKRAQENPSYYGILEISKEEEGLVLINELSLEQYLYAVVPSEMPASYGLEALKAQAVCARSYAYRNILENSLSEFGAHVNDSIAFQVYNNQPEAEASTNAVEDTRGQIMSCQGEIVQAYYFSTSSGHTTDADIWGEGISLPYIKGKYVWQEQKETEFEEFIMDENFPSYDSSFPWYRWNVFFSMADLEKCLENKGLSAQTGRVTGMKVSRRGTGGIAKELTVYGERGTVIIEKEYAIRCFLVPAGLSLRRKDGEVLTEFSLLPSAFFTAKEVWEGGILTGYQIYGGGYGHGAGMSQNAVKSMTEQGMSYLEILKFFYTDIEIENIMGDDLSS